MEKLNLDFLAKTVVDSCEIVPPIVFYVPINKKGLYDGEVFAGNRNVAKISVRVSNDAYQKQENIDLNSLKREGINVFDLRTDGYLVFYSQTGREAYRVIVSGNDKIIFDNTRLSGEEMITVTLMTPGKYNMRDASSGAQGSIEILTPKEGDVSTINEPFIIQIIENSFVTKDGDEIKSTIKITMGTYLFFSKVMEDTHLKFEPAEELKYTWDSPRKMN